LVVVGVTAAITAPTGVVSIHRPAGCFRRYRLGILAVFPRFSVTAGICVQGARGTHKRLMLLATLTLMTAAVRADCCPLNGGLLFFFGGPISSCPLSLPTILLREALPPRPSSGGLLMSLLSRCFLIVAGTAGLACFADGVALISRSEQPAAFSRLIPKQTCLFRLGLFMGLFRIGYPRA